MGTDSAGGGRRVTKNAPVPYPLQLWRALLRQSRLPLRGGADRRVRDRGRESVIAGLKSADFILKVTYSFLQPTHFLDHPRVGCANVTE